MALIVRVQARRTLSRINDRDRREFSLYTISLSPVAADEEIDLTQDFLHGCHKLEREHDIAISC